MYVFRFLFGWLVFVWVNPESLRTDAVVSPPEHEIGAAFSC